MVAAETCVIAIRAARVAGRGRVVRRRSSSAQRECGLRARIGLVGMLWALCGAPCAHAIVGGSPDLEPPDSPQQRVDPNRAESPWAGVGSLSVLHAETGELQGTYTAAAIDLRHVLTAAHVVHGRAPAQIRFNLNHGGDLTHRIAAAEVHVHPDYTGFRPDPRTGIVHDDLAVVRLSEPLPFGVPLYRIYPNPLPLGSVLTLVGYGGAGDGVRGVTVPGSASVKRIGRNVFDRGVRDNGGSGAIEVYLFDFDGPDAASNRMGGSTLGNDREATLAGGDSGSPAFVPAARGAWWIVGVNTFVAPQASGRDRFGALAGGMLLHAYRGWIESVLEGVAP